MPRNPKAGKSTGDLFDRLFRFLLPQKTKYNDNSNGNNSDVESNTNNGKQPELNPNIIINVPENDNSASILEQRRQNTLTKINIVVSALLLICTLVALLLTYRSVKIAEQALSDSRKKDSLSYIRDTVNERKQDEKDQFNMEVSKQSLQEQIKLINETQRQFNITNIPYLQIDSASIKFDDNIQRGFIDLKLYNATQAPAQAINYHMVTSMIRQGTPINFYEQTKKLQSDIANNMNDYGVPLGLYVSKGAPVSVHNYAFFVDENEYYRAKKGQYTYLVYCKIKYLDLINGKRRVYECSLHLSLTPLGVEVMPYLSKNYGIK